jgi:hypothetical protein
MNCALVAAESSQFGSTVLRRLFRDFSIQLSHLLMPYPSFTLPFPFLLQKGARTFTPAATFLAVLGMIPLPIWGGHSACAHPGLTIYNAHFAVVRDTVPLDLKAGENSVRYSGATASLDPSTVILRDPEGKIPLSVLEQNYQNDPVNQLTLLDRFEGQLLSFLVHDSQKGDRILEAKVIRSGYVPGGNPMEPMIEVEGKIMFELPGRPLFPAVKDDGVLLKPVLSWKIQSPEAANLQAELAYLTQGLEWSASYNLVLPEASATADLNGWVTINNRSGKQFDSANIKLLAGDVHRATPRVNPEIQAFGLMKRALVADSIQEEVSEKTFDDFHLYTLPRPTTLRDQETKQVEFMKAGGIPTRRLYTYEAQAGAHFLGHNIFDSDWGAASLSKKVASTLEFTNTEESKLGLPMPAGVLRVYRKDGDQMEFVGEDRIEHTPRREKVRVSLGNAFDLVGERKRVDFQIDQSRRMLDESFEIRLRNQSKNAVEIRVLEHFVRAANWSFVAQSQEFHQLDSHTAECVVPVAAEEESVLTYKVHYTW